MLGIGTRMMLRKSRQSVMLISTIERSVKEDYVQLSAEVSGTAPLRAPRRLWFRFPRYLEDVTTDDANPFLAAMLPLAMRERRSIVIEGRVSRQLLAGTQQIMRIFASWDRSLKPVRIDAEPAEATAELNTHVACFFTAGVDSFYTLLKNQQTQRGNERISHLLCVQGFPGFPLNNAQLYRYYHRSLGQIASELGLGAIIAETNLSDFVPAFTPWDYHAGSNLAAVALCLPRLFRCAYIPAGDTYATLSRWGSHPLVDPLWSTESLEFRHDGCEAARSQKIEWYLARSRLALNHLRVCGYESTGERNCGRCEKCLRTMIGLHIFGVLDQADVFAEPLDLDRVRSMNGSALVTRFYLRDNLQALRRSTPDPNLESALQEALRPHAGRWAALRLQNLARSLDQRLFRGRLRTLVVRHAGTDVEKRASLSHRPFSWVVRECLNWALSTRRNSNGQAKKQPQQQGKIEVGK